MRWAPEQSEDEPLPPLSERGHEVRKRLTAVRFAILSHPPPEDMTLGLLFDAELAMRRGQPLDVDIDQRRADLADASPRGEIIKQHLDRALIAFDRLEQEDRNAILLAFNGRPLMQVNVSEVMPDLPLPQPIPRPGGAPGEVLTRIDEVLLQIGGKPGDDDREKRTLRKALVTALASNLPGSKLERPDLPIFAPGTRGAEIMPHIKAVVAAFDALADSDRRALRPWLARGRLIHVTIEEPLKDSES